MAFNGHVLVLAGVTLVRKDPFGEKIRCITVDTYTLKNTGFLTFSCRKLWPSLAESRIKSIVFSCMNSLILTTEMIAIKIEVSLTGNLQVNKCSLEDDKIETISCRTASEQVLGISNSMPVVLCWKTGLFKKQRTSAGAGIEAKTSPRLASKKNIEQTRNDLHETTNKFLATKKSKGELDQWSKAFNSWLSN